MSTEDLKEYIITVRDYNDLDRFYEDMETPGGNLYIPGRSVEVTHRREISRNTHYYLSAAEADQIRNDPRVLAVEPAENPYVEKKLVNIINGNFDYGFSITSNMCNWGLDFTTKGVANAGSIIKSYARLPTTGKNVDIVIVDGHITAPGHPEYAKKPDGSGGSRVIQQIWASGYAYTSGYGAYHGGHVASTAAGNRQGWACDANIYNINPFEGWFVFDLIRIWHANKSVNPATGRKNPTVTNNSWGTGASVAYTDVQEAWFAGGKVYDRVRDGTFTKVHADRAGINSFLGILYIPQRDFGIDADAYDAWNDGILNIGAAGNDSTYCGVFNDTYWYDRVVTTSGYTMYTHRGMSPGAAGAGMINVGSIWGGSSSTGWLPYRSSFSNHGPAVNIFAPGSDIMGAMSPDYTGTTVADPRNSQYKLAKISGTSMASPQVAGVAACVLEQNPTFTPIQTYNYLMKFAKSNFITTYSSLDPYGNSWNPLLDPGSLAGAPNTCLFYHKFRPDEGMNWPRVNNDDRPTQGQSWPRMTKY